MKNKDIEEKFTGIPLEILQTASLRNICKIAGIKHPQTVKYYLEKAGIDRPQSKLIKKQIKKNALKVVLRTIVDRLHTGTHLDDAKMIMKMIDCL